MSLAIRPAAETDLSAIHAIYADAVDHAAQTVDRIVNVFPADKQPHVRTMLSTSLRGVISQQLLQRADGNGRVAALEILINTSAVANLIRQGKLDQLETRRLLSGEQDAMDAIVAAANIGMADEAARRALGDNGITLAAMGSGEGLESGEIGRAAEISVVTGNYVADMQ